MNELKNELSDTPVIIDIICVAILFLIGLLFFPYHVSGSLLAILIFQCYCRTFMKNFFNIQSKVLYTPLFICSTTKNHIFYLEQEYIIHIVSQLSGLICLLLYYIIYKHNPDPLFLDILKTISTFVFINSLPIVCFDGLKYWRSIFLSIHKFIWFLILILMTISICIYIANTSYIFIFFSVLMANIIYLEAHPITTQRKIHWKKNFVYFLLSLSMTGISFSIWNKINPDTVKTFLSFFSI